MIQKKKYDALRVVKDNGGATATEFASLYYKDTTKKVEARKILENLKEENLVRTPNGQDKYVVSNLGLLKMEEYENAPKDESPVSTSTKKKGKKK